MADTGTSALTDHVPITGLLTRRGAVRAQPSNQLKIFLLNAAAVRRALRSWSVKTRTLGASRAFRMLVARSGAYLAASRRRRFLQVCERAVMPLMACHDSRPTGHGTTLVP
jgi:hypothetical protein